MIVSNTKTGYVRLLNHCCSSCVVHVEDAC